MKVYNPGDPGEPNQFGFNGHVFALQPNADCEIDLPRDAEGKVLVGFEKIQPKAILNACLEQLRQVGVVLLSGDEKADKILREGAEVLHTTYLRDRYSPVVERHAAALKRSAEAGVVPPDEPGDVTRAKGALKKRGLLAALAFLLLTTCANAQNVAANFTYSRTLASGTKTYCKLAGALGNPFGGAIQGNGRLTTTGASTTVNADNTSAFSSISTPSATKGAVLLVSTDSVSLTAYRVVTKTDNDTVVIDTSVNWAAPGNVWQWFDETCGTADTDGWIDSRSGDVVTVMYVGGSTTANTVIECRGSGIGALPVQVYPDNSGGAATRNLTAADVNNRYMWALTPDLRCTGIRVGFQGTNPIVTAFIERLK